MKTIFITGASSGIGRATAKLFQSKGWNVIATMRNPQNENELTAFKNVIVLKCDVTKGTDIKNAIQTGLQKFGKIDVLVNNAGYYSIGVFESAADDEIERQIDTNLLGVIKVTKEIIPHFRERKSGVIINVSSIAGLISVPLQSLYHATKWGVEGFSETLQYELRQFNIKVKIIEPGVIATDFFGRSMTVSQDDNLTEYNSYAQKVLKNLKGGGEKGSSPVGTANTIYKAATDKKSKLRYPTGNSNSFVYARKILPVSLFRKITQMVME